MRDRGILPSSSNLADGSQRNSPLPAKGLFCPCTMKITFLGTGTSHGIPVIGCTCPVCVSTDPRNKRLRSSLLVEADGLHIVIDTSCDFRQQALRFGLDRIDAVLYTHHHADHIFGFDDLRRYGQMYEAPIPAYGSPDTLNHLAAIFAYAFQTPPEGTTRPRVDLHPVEGPFNLDRINIDPLRVLHGAAHIYGYVLTHEDKRIGYFPDCSGIPNATLERLQDLDMMILDTLRHRPHPTHFNLDQGRRALQAISAKRSYITHLCHDLDHETTEMLLHPDSIRLAYDGLVLDV